MRRVTAIAVALVVTLFAAGAAAEPEPPTHLTVPTTVSDGEGHELHLTPGYFLTEETWARLDEETKRLQDQETRLTAENQVLRDAGGGMPSWWWVAAGIAAGAAGGWFVGSRL